MDEWIMIAENWGLEFKESRTSILSHGTKHLQDRLTGKLWEKQQNQHDISKWERM